MRIIFCSVVLLLLIYVINVSIDFADQSNINSSVQHNHSDDENVHLHAEDVIPESVDGGHIKYSLVADRLAEMLIAIRNVIAKNQELINRDPVTGKYSFKDFVPAIVGSQVANDFSLRTEWRIKQTSLKLRNLNNEPDEWEEKVLKLFETGSYMRNGGFGEVVIEDKEQLYRYMKPIYVEASCLQCHGRKENIKPAIMRFLKGRYPHDNAFGYKDGELRGGISIAIPINSKSDPVK